jgi:two-component system sensor histidine kinase/response regulator
MNAEPRTRVLLVEDSATQAMATRATLEEGGFAVSVAIDGEAALAQFAGAPTELIISDVVMPGIDGYEFCRRLKATALGRRIPVILLTDLSEPMDIIRGLACGADTFVTKPYERERLIDRSWRLIKGRRLRSGRDDDPTVEDDVLFLGQQLRITSSRSQILDMLLATFEDAVRTNLKLREREQELEHSNRTLDEQAQELTRLNEAQRRFVGLISHEFRTPLFGIQGFSELIRDETLTPDEIRDYASRINSEAKRLVRMITEILDLDRMESGHMTLTLGDVRINEVILSVVDYARPGAPQHRFTNLLDPALPVMTADQDKIVQVMTNLVSNAVKYSPAAGTITITTARDGDTVHVSVKDEGIGIPADALEKVFERFTRVERESLGDIKGTGLGLPIVREIVELHGGRVWAESPAGEGSTFHVELPIDVVIG